MSDPKHSLALSYESLLFYLGCTTQGQDIEDITWLRGGAKFLFETEKNFARSLLSNPMVFVVEIEKIE